MNTTQFYQQAGGRIGSYLWQELQISPQTNYRVTGVLNGPRLLVMQVVINPTYARRIMSMSTELSMAAGLGKDHTIRIGRGLRGSLVLEIPKPSELWFNISLGQLPKHRGVKASMGIDSEHVPALVDFSNPATAHILIAGATGSGKTNAGKLLAYDLASQNDPAELSLILIDTRKKSAWREFERLPHLAHPVITDDATALQALGWATAEIDRRAPSGQSKPRVFIGIDEAQVLLESEPFIKPIVTLAGIGREYGIHLALLTQNPTAAALGDTSIKRNITARLVGRVDSAEAAKVATGQPGTGANQLTGTGDMLLIQPGTTRRITTALLTGKDLATLPSGGSLQRLDFDEYEDIDHVMSQAGVAEYPSGHSQGSPGRKPDPMDPVHIARVMIEPAMSQRQLYRDFGVGFSKAKEVIDFARGILAALDTLGYEVVQRNRIGCNEIKQVATK
jgi:S-DNA-T family DNA segregation ATPase FtsK/SpoIIIE